jgi:hypothetical protein
LRMSIIVVIYTLNYVSRVAERSLPGWKLIFMWDAAYAHDLDWQNKCYVSDMLSYLSLVSSSPRSNARLQGFEQDLHLQGQQYATVLSVFYVGYIIMQVPAWVTSIIKEPLFVTFLAFRNMFLHWLERPSVFLPSCIVVWGAISALTGLSAWVVLEDEYWWWPRDLKEVCPAIVKSL